MAERSVNPTPARIDVEADPPLNVDAVRRSLSSAVDSFKAKGMLVRGYAASVIANLSACLDRIAELEAELARVAPVVAAAKAWRETFREPCTDDVAVEANCMLRDTVDEHLDSAPDGEGGAK